MPKVRTSSRQRASNADPVKAGRGSPPGYISAKSQVQIPTRQPVNSKAGQGSRSISQDSKPKVRIPTRQPVKAGQGSRSVSRDSKPKVQMPTRQPVKAGQGSRSVSRASKPKVQIPTKQLVKYEISFRRKFEQRTIVPFCGPRVWLNLDFRPYSVQLG